MINHQQLMVAMVCFSLGFEQSAGASQSSAGHVSVKMCRPHISPPQQQSMNAVLVLLLFKQNYVIFHSTKAFTYMYMYF